MAPSALPLDPLLEGLMLKIPRKFNEKYNVKDKMNGLETKQKTKQNKLGCRIKNVS